MLAADHYHSVATGQATIMRFLLHLGLLLLGLTLVTSSVLNRKPYTRYLKGTPIKPHVFRQDAKGHGTTTPLYPRKGEYVCATGLCKLKPGQVPSGCRDLECQYPIEWK